MKKYIMVYIVVIYLGLVAGTDAYTISRNRVLTPPLPSQTTITTTTTLVIPSYIVEINRLKPSGESWVYQRAYYDAVADVKEVLGYGKGATPRATVAAMRNQLAPEFKTCFCYNQSYAEALKPVLANLSYYNLSISR